MSRPVVDNEDEIGIVNVLLNNHKYFLLTNSIMFFHIVVFVIAPTSRCFDIYSPGFFPHTCLRPLIYRHIIKHDSFVRAERISGKLLITFHRIWFYFFISFSAHTFNHVRYFSRCPLQRLLQFFPILLFRIDYYDYDLIPWLWSGKNIIISL